MVNERDQTRSRQLAGYATHELHLLQCRGQNALRLVPGRGRQCLNSLSRPVTIDTGSAIDVESPEVMEFTLPLTSTSLTVPILAFRAIDNIDAVAYLITTTPTEPAANAQGWRATPPRAIPLLPGARRHFTAGPRTRPGTSRKVSGTTWS